MKWYFLENRYWSKSFPQETELGYTMKLIIYMEYHDTSDFVLTLMGSERTKAESFNKFSSKWCFPTSELTRMKSSFDETWSDPDWSRNREGQNLRTSYQRRIGSSSWLFRRRTRYLNRNGIWEVSFCVVTYEICAQTVLRGRADSVYL